MCAKDKYVYDAYFGEKVVPTHLQQKTVAYSSGSGGIKKALEGEVWKKYLLFR